MNQVNICGCNSGDCHYKEGNLKTEKRAEAIVLMWDGIVYESKEKAQEVMEKYIKDGFGVELIEEEKHYLLYARRVVTRTVLEGQPPLA